MSVSEVWSQEETKWLFVVWGQTPHHIKWMHAPIIICFCCYYSHLFIDIQSIMLFDKELNPSEFNNF